MTEPTNVEHNLRYIVADLLRAADIADATTADIRHDPDAARLSLIDATTIRELSRTLRRDANRLDSVRQRAERRRKGEQS